MTFPLRPSYAFSLASALTLGLAMPAAALAEDHAKPQSNAQPASAKSAETAKPVKDVVIELKAGQVLQVIASQVRPDGAAARRAYAQTAFPIASSFGFAPLGTLAVKQQVVSDFEPEAFSFFSWPSEEAVQSFDNHPDWPAIKATRPAAWNELKVYSDTLEEDLSLRFRPDKYYTVVAAWFDPDNPGDYDRYLTGIESAVERAGGRFIYKMREPSFEAHASALTPPGQVTFVEWDRPDGFAEVQKSDEYLANRQYFASGLERFEFYWLGLPDA